MNARPKLSNLTPDDRVWRLDWFGECAYPGSVRRYAQPSIKVVFSPLRSDPADHAALISPDSTDHQYLYEIQECQEVALLINHLRKSHKLLIRLIYC